MPNETADERRFAVRVVEELRQAGYEALWAGGCVRDQILGRTPSDYDVATNATPSQVRNCFKCRRTLSIGAAFGVITVLGSRSEGQIEVATFRSDAQYSDGRHPDHVTFSNAREDARRRDFTMNGLFYDPLTDEVIDYVGGQQDLDAGIVRAIGDPFERFGEDKLRMLRAARFAATFNFQLDQHTLTAVRKEARGLTVVSAERIATELRKMLAHPNRALAAELLRKMGLLPVILPESLRLLNSDQNETDDDQHGKLVAPAKLNDTAELWQQTVGILAALDSTTFRVALSALLWGICQHDANGNQTVVQICNRWKLSNLESKGASWLLANEPIIRRASEGPWPQLQRVLISDDIDELLTLATAVGQHVDRDISNVDYCRDKLRLSSECLNPPYILTGDDLQRAGFTAGPIFRKILTEVRDAQLDKKITDRNQALELAQRIVSRDS